VICVSRDFYQVIDAWLVAGPVRPKYAYYSCPLSISCSLDARRQFEDKPGI